MIHVYCRRQFNRPLPQAVLTLLQRIFGDVSRTVSAIDRVAQQADDPLLGFFPGSFKGAAGGIAMPATAEQLGHARDVDVAFRAQARAIDAWRALLEQGDRFDFTNGQWIVNKTVSVFIGSTSTFLHLRSL